MSGEEKAAQVGEAVQNYQAAKVEHAHIQTKIKKVFTAYIEAGRSMDERQGTTMEPKLVNGKLQLGYGRENPADLMNEKELTALIEERDKARSALNQARETMNALGITGVS